MSELKMRASLDASGVKSGVSEAKSSVKSLGTTLQTALGFGLAQVVSNAVGLIKDGVVGALKIGAKFEMMSIQIESLIGNTAKAKKLMRELTEFSAGTPFSLEDIFKSGKTLLTQFPSKDIIKELTTIGNVSATTGKDLAELTLAFTKVASRGNMSSEILNQFTEANIPIERYLMLVKKVGGGIRQLAEEGKISWTDFHKAMQMMAADMNGLEVASKTLGGSFTGVVRETQLMGVAFTEAAKPELIGFLDRLKSILSDIRPVGAAVGWVLGGIVGNINSMIDGLRMLNVAAGVLNPKYWWDLATGGDPQAELDKQFDQIINDWEKRQKKIGELTGNKEIGPPQDAMRAGADRGLGGKALSGDAAMGLFRAGNVNVDYAALQLEEQRRTNLLLEELKRAYDQKVIDYALAKEGTDGWFGPRTIRNGAGS